MNLGLEGTDKGAEVKKGSGFWGGGVKVDIGSGRSGNGAGLLLLPYMGTGGSRT